MTKNTPMSLIDMNESEIEEFIAKHLPVKVLEKKKYETGVGSEILNDEYMKTCVTTTTYLAEKLKKYEKKVFVSKNDPFQNGREAG